VSMSGLCVAEAEIGLDVGGHYISRMVVERVASDALEHGCADAELGSENPRTRRPRRNLSAPPRLTNQSKIELSVTK
jgi:hypothetical protein